MIDFQYVDLIDTVMREGIRTPDRTSVGASVQSFGESIRYNASEYAPLISCRTFSPKVSFLEWIWMMNGNTDSKWLEERGVTIWEGNTTREFLDGRNLHHLPEGSVGKSYGHQFRNFGGVDQLKVLFDGLKNDPYSRRHIISLWNVPELDAAPLHPCCFLYEFMVQPSRSGNTIHLHQHMRSADLILGVPYNLTFGHFFIKAVSEVFGFIPGDHLLTMTNCHVYENLVDIAKEMKPPTSFTTPKISFKRQLKSLEDVLSLDYNDVLISDWNKGPKIGSPEMAK